MATDTKSASAPLRVLHLDAFADRPFTGNPAAVVLVPASRSLSDSFMLQVAAEFNLSETAFVQALPTTTPSSDDPFQTDNVFGLRWFTPTVEVPLCGHATLASAGALLHCLSNSNDTLTFNTLSGDLLVSVDAARPHGVSMTFPTNPTRLASSETATTIYAAVCAQALSGAAEAAEVEFSPGTNKLIVRLPDSTTREALESIAPSQSGMHSVDQSELPVEERVRGVSITCRAPPDSSTDFYSRYFTPWNGIPEDSVNGSSHTALGPFWSKRLGKTELLAEMCSKRSGKLVLRMESETASKIGIGGAVLEFMSGHLKAE